MMSPVKSGATSHRERVLPKHLVYWRISVDAKTGVAHKLLMATNQIDEVSENNRVILSFSLDPVGAVSNRTGHRLKIAQLIN